MVEALKKIKPPVIRWPGGCFADSYHWQDGIGPRADRPVRRDHAWGEIETNRFGTDLPDELGPFGIDRESRSRTQGLVAGFVGDDGAGDGTCGPSLADMDLQGTPEAVKKQALGAR